jgi:hypothetical protein
MDLDKRSAWQRKIDEECPYQVVLPRRQLTDDSAILDFLLANVEWFDMYVTSKTTMRRTCAIASKIRSTPKFSARVLNRRLSASSSRDERVISR